jgi:hypothetical protein
MPTVGDGLPSIASVDLGEDMSFSESSDLQKARKLYAELQAMSMESTGSTEVIHLFAHSFLNSAALVKSTRSKVQWL